MFFFGVRRLVFIIVTLHFHSSELDFVVQASAICDLEPPALCCQYLDMKRAKNGVSELVDYGVSEVYLSRRGDMLWGGGGR